MAVSPAHRFGQIIGEVLELGIEPLLATFARRHGLYLDKKGERTCRPGRKCTWVDLKGNAHDLDYVLEREGSGETFGIPVAFIETAWRRYTKHSRNKAQEIQGAVEPLVERYQHAGPFKGAILAGEFTGGALTQLRSRGFTVLFFPYESVVEVFRGHGIDAAYDEGTSDRDFGKKVKAFERLTPKRRVGLANDLLKAHRADVDQFIVSLTAAVSRKIERIVVLALHGSRRELTTVEDAVAFVESYDEGHAKRPIDRYEILIRYSNGDRIEASFGDKQNAVRHLKSFQPADALAT